MAVEDTVVTSLLNKQKYLESKDLSKIKIPLAAFQKMNDEERMRFLVSELEKELQLSRQYGIDKFEGLLSCVDLSGPVDQEIKREIRECHNLRNIIVHRDSVADSRFAEACPWLGCRAGERVRVTVKMLQKYEAAVVAYATGLMQRIERREKGGA